MSPRVVELLSRVEAFADGLRSGTLMADIIREYEPEIIDMNAEDQLFTQGRNALGVDISDYAPYTPDTEEIKALKGQPYDRVTLRDTGDFHESFYLEITDSEFTVKADDPKTPSLVKRYGRQIFGLTDDNRSVLTWDYVFPAIIEKAKSMIYGNK